MFHSKGKVLLQLAALVAALGVLFVLVVYADPGTITVRKETVPPGGTGFEFTDDIPGGPALFYLDDGQQEMFLQVPDGKYTITETNPAVIPGGWKLTSIVCEDENGITWEFKRQATTTVEISQTRQIVECVFTNTQWGDFVGGYVMPVNKLELLVPWLGLIVLTGLAASGVVLVRKLKV